MNGRMSAHTIVRFSSDGTKDWGFSYSVNPEIANDGHTQSEIYYFRIFGRSPDGNWLEIQGVDYQSPLYTYFGKGESMVGQTYELFTFPKTQWNAGIYDPVKGDVSVTVGKGNIEVLGSAKADTWYGLVGANDTIYGYGGRDMLSGGGGNDYIDGGSGEDTLTGGSGSDTYVIDSPKDKIVENADQGIDLVLASVSFTLAANVENITLTGSKAINGTGNSGSNAMTGNNAPNKLVGAGGNDTLNGGSGNDVLMGGAGRDKLYGGAGADDLHGGAGADVFAFKAIKDSAIATSGRDSIFDFNTEHSDRIDLSAIDANSALSGNQNFSFIAKSAFSHRAGEIRYEQKSEQTYVYGDVNGDGRADLVIQLKGLSTLSIDHFVL